MTTFFLIRHAAQDDVSSRLAGRAPGAILGEAGRLQARRLGERMRDEGLEQIHTSPRERAVETAETVAQACGLGPIAVADALDEVDFGAWSGQPFHVLEHDARWRRWNERRSFARAPDGESILEVQARIMRHIERAREALGDGSMALVTHAEPIRAALAYCLGLTLDAWSLLEISPASITRIRIDDRGATILSVNETLKAW